ncbi:type III secretion HpaP family protein [Desulfocurvus sp.]|uniref:type III secretion HpaP family protein n=1 Tax=Desulfocurvus sp. TaxID=2871698 RepID=UPI0025BACA5B|nr:type III secretion HpaP family protein [Desulfocurvus sp.]MCK9239984.1 type III secretion HpaP family protein [Desulfocurvus sp.]
MSDAVKPVGGAPPQAGPGGPGPTADPADVHAMRAALAGPVESPGLSSLFSLQGRAAAQATPRPGEPGSADAADADAGGSGDRRPRDEADPEELADLVAERVLVTDKDFSDDEEVRIYLRRSVLADTQVHLRRTPEGVEVRVLTGDAASHAVLLEAKDALGRRLQGACQGRVLLEIVFVRKA